MSSRSSKILVLVAAAGVAMAAVGMNAVGQVGGSRSQEGGERVIDKTLLKDAGGKGDQDSVTRQSVDLNFKGGPLSEFIKALRAATAPTPCNVLVTGSGEEPIVPPCEFRGVSVVTAALVVEHASEGVSVAVVREEAGAPVFVFRYYSVSKEDRATDVISIKTLLERDPMDPESVQIALRPETVLSAMENAAEISKGSSSSPAQIRFHEDSGLVFVRGTKAEIATVRETVNNLHSDIDRRRQVFSTSGTRKLETAIAKAKIELEYLEQHMRMKADECAYIQKMVEAGAESVETLAKAKDAAASAKADLEKGKVEQRQLEVELQLIRPHYDGSGEQGGAAAPAEGEKGTQAPAKPAK